MSDSALEHSSPDAVVLNRSLMVTVFPDDPSRNPHFSPIAARLILLQPARQSCRTLLVQCRLIELSGAGSS
jgi:hypothetical protein